MCYLHACFDNYLTVNGILLMCSIADKLRGSFLGQVQHLLAYQLAISYSYHWGFDNFTLLPLLIVGNAECPLPPPPPHPLPSPPHSTSSSYIEGSAECHPPAISRGHPTVLVGELEWGGTPHSLLYTKGKRSVCVCVWGGGGGGGGHSASPTITK